MKALRIWSLAILTCAAHATAAEVPVVMDYRMVLSAVREKATQQVLTSTRSDDAFLRANAMEAAENLRDRATPIVQLGMNDAQPVVRFSALATAGRLKIKDLAPALAQQVGSERENVQRIALRVLDREGQMTDEQRADFRQQLVDAQSVYAGALFAAARCGAKVDLSPMAHLLARKDPTLRANVAILLGMMDDKTSIPMLREMARVPIPRANPVQVTLCRLQIAEAMVKLGDEDSLDAIRAAAYSQLDEVRVLAVQMLGKLTDRRMEKGLVVMLPDPPLELQLAAAASLARLGNADGLDITLRGCTAAFEPARAQAASALGLFKDSRAAQMIVKLLDDPSEQVRLAAAASALGALR